MNVRAVTLTLAVLALSIAAFAQGPRRDGKWEVQTQMEMEGMPGMPPRTSTQCLTPEDVNDPQKSLMPDTGRGGPQACKVADQKIEGNKVSWTMKCESGFVTGGSGEMLYAGDTYTGTIKMETGRGGMTMKMSGKRLGDCVK